MRHLCFLFACALCLAACREPATAVMVVVTADDSVRNETVRLRYVVMGGPGTNMLGSPRDADTPTPGPGSWPVIIPIIPRDNDASRAFSVEVHAVGTTGDLVIARGISGFTRGETRALFLHLAESCRGAASNCPQTETCEGGVCRDAFIPPNELPPYGQPPPGPDAGPRDDGGIPPNCGNSIIDAPLEECDDGNDFPGDGCELNCQFSCDTGLDCEDGNDCTVDHCNDVLIGGALGHACNYDLLNGDACEVTPGNLGMCVDGACIGGGCGDRNREPGELCYAESGIIDYGLIGPDPSNLIASGDFDVDGQTDIVIGNSGSQVFAVRFSGVDGVTGGPIIDRSFSAPCPPFFGAGDPDRNGRASVFAPNWNGCGGNCFSRVDIDFDLFSFSIMNEERFPGPILAAGTGDLDGDDFGDFAIAHFTPTFPPANLGVSYLLTNPTNGDFFRQPEEPLDSSNPTRPLRMVGGARPGFPPALWMLREDGFLERYESFGDVIGPLQTQTSVPIDTSQPVSLVLAEIAPGAGHLLLITAANPAGEVTARIFDPEALFQLDEFAWGAFEPVAFAAMGDIDNDGDSDIVVVTLSRIQILVNRDPVALVFEMGPSIDLPCGTRSATSADFNLDGAPDLALATDCGLSVLVARP